MPSRPILPPARRRALSLLGISPYVTFHGRRYRRAKRDNAAVGRLQSMITLRDSALEHGEVPQRLVQFRGDFRAIVYWRPITGLVECLKSERRELQRLALWLIGRCGKNRGASAVAVFRRHEDPLLRREAARALRRLGGWPALQTMALHDPDPRVRLLATCAPPPEFTARFSRFTQTVREVTPALGHKARMPLFVRFSIGPGKAAKTREAIRRLLEHIRYLVHGVRNRSSENGG